MIRRSLRYSSRLVRYILKRPHSSQTHPFHALIAAQAIHSSVLFEGSQCSLIDGVDVRIDENSIFLGKLSFFNAGKFYMGRRSYVGPNTLIQVSQSIEIGDDVMISWNCTLIDTDNHSIDFSERKNDVLITGNFEGFALGDKNWSVVKCEPICIENKVWVGFNSIILKGVTLGEGCVVGAGSVVTKNVEPWSIVAGNPARFIRHIN